MTHTATHTPLQGNSNENCECRTTQAEIVFCPLHYAAPAMYEALSSLVQFLVENDERWLDNQYVLDAKQALAQAEGR